MFLAFLAFVAYVGCTALATTAGRTAVIASRYMTPMLLGWAALGILLVFAFRAHPKFPDAAAVLSVLVPLLLLPSQLEVLRSDPAITKHRRMVAALALGVRDTAAVGEIYPFDSIYSIASEAKRLGLSIFSLPNLVNAQKYLHQPAKETALSPCRGELDRRAVTDDAGVSAIGGWAFDGEAGRVPGEVILVDSDNRVVGVGLTGLPRPDLARSVGENVGIAGFDGYLFDGKGSIRFECPK
jgi:hypothetical protein